MRIGGVPPCELLSPRILGDAKRSSAAVASDDSPTRAMTALDPSAHSVTVQRLGYSGVGKLCAPRGLRPLAEVSGAACPQRHLRPAGSSTAVAERAGHLQQTSSTLSRIRCILWSRCGISHEHAEVVKVITVNGTPLPRRWV